MSKTKKILAITSLFIFLGMFFVFTNSAHAITYKAQIGFGKISGTMTIGPDSIGLYITEVYKYAVSVVGILASIVLMWGGVRWLTAGGDSSAVDDAKKWIEGALSGLVLVMTSYVILYFVNPDLIKFKSIKIDPIKAVVSSEVKTNSEIACGVQVPGQELVCGTKCEQAGYVCQKVANGTNGSRKCPETIGGTNDSWVCTTLSSGGSDYCTDNADSQCKTGFICNMYLMSAIIDGVIKHPCAVRGVENRGCDEDADCATGLRCISNRCHSS